MENSTSFDLNRAIQQWRENLAHSPSFRSENLDELETHLRDSVASLQKSGLSVEEAFIVAIKRMGPEDALEKEFGKLNRRTVWLQRVLWMLIGIQVWHFTYGLITLVAQNAAFFGLRSLGFDFATGGRAFPVAVLSLAGLVGLMGSVAMCWWLVGEGSERISARLVKVLQSVPGTLAAFAVICLLMFSTTGLGFALEMLRIKIVSQSDFGQYALSRQYVSFMMLAIQTAAFLALTLFLARRRLCADRA